MVVGNIRETFSIYSDGVGNEIGTIAIGETGFFVKMAAGENYAVPYGYVRSMDITGELILGKKKAVLSFNDVMGDSHEIAFMAQDMKIAALKEACGK